MSPGLIQHRDPRLSSERRVLPAHLRRVRSELAARHTRTPKPGCASWMANVSMGQPRRFPGFAAHPSGQVSQVQGTQRQRAHRLGTLTADCFLAVLEAGEAGIKVPAASVTAGDTRAGFRQRPLRCAHTASPRWCRGRRPLLLGHKATASHGAYACTRAHTQTLIPS